MGQTVPFRSVARALVGVGYATHGLPALIADRVPALEGDAEAGVEVPVQERARVGVQRRQGGPHRFDFPAAHLEVAARAARGVEVREADG